MPEVSTSTLPVLPLPDGVVFPEMVVTVTLASTEARTAVAAAPDGRILLVPRRSGGSASFASVGVIASIENRGKLPDGTPALTIRGLQRARVGAGVVGDAPGLWVEVEPVEEPEPDENTTALAAEYRAAATALLDRIGGSRMAGALNDIASPGQLADTIAYWPELSTERRIELLETVDVEARLRLALEWVAEALAEVEVASDIARSVGEDLDRTQREAILRRQLAAIREELGDGDGDARGDYRARLAAVADHMPEATVRAIETELDRLERMGNESMESNWIRTWLDTVFDLPWGRTEVVDHDLVAARQILDADHTGLEEVKERLVEYLAIRRLRAERGLDPAPRPAAAAHDGTDDEGEIDDADDAAGEEPDGVDGQRRRSEAGGPGARRSGVILSLVGPPGVGKTSLGESVARALGRSFVRVSLGGIRDEAEIRGHRRTYVGARPGRLVRALIEAGSMNPVVLLDEVDKLGNGWQGDPSAALLEVLDPAQNSTFRDNYLEFELDLSQVVFIATANVVDTIPGPLLDRLEVITVDGYTTDEKAAIARTHLLPRLIERNGLHPGEVDITDEVIAAVAADWTREAGVRRLERLLDKLVRKAATRIAGGAEAPVVFAVDELRALLGRPVPAEEVADRIDRPGIATGLAVTGAGGDVLFVETALIAGDGEPLLTGQLGDVMKESAVIARSVVAAHGERYGARLPDHTRLHVHFPAGAVPKDGPSAGITMTTALISLLSGRTVRPEVAMTGEVTLQGRVLPIGGVKQKLLAAHRAGIREVVLPKANGEDLDDVPAEVLEHLTVHLAHDIDDVLAVALTPV
ncbi:MAG: endopeptidase La [Acidimicrobiales bacterium]